MPGIAHEARARVAQLEVENFKSYQGRQVIGPFHGFTAVIGPNGSGKSNLMDAISFVLGVKGAQLRASLKELLHSYTEADQAPHRPEHGHVKLLLEVDDGSSVSFQRAIAPGRAGEGYVSVYSINGQQVTWAAYEAKLGSFGILVKARNFLVFQGDIEAVAAKQPMELTRLFESVSGSDALRGEYERAEAAKRDADDRHQFVQSRKKSSALEKRQKKEQKEEAEQYMRQQQELVSLKSTHCLWQLYHAQRDEEAAEAEREAAQQKLKAAASELKAAEAAVKEQKRKVAALAKQRQAAEAKVRKKRAEVDKRNPDHVKTGIERERVAKKLRAQEHELQALQDKAAAHDAKVAQLQQQLDDLEAAERDCDGQAGPGSQVLPPEIMHRYRHLKEGARAKTARARADLASLQTVQSTEEQALHEAQDSLASVAGRLQQLEAAREGAAASSAAQAEELARSRGELKAKQQALRQQQDQNRRNRSLRMKLEERRRGLEERLRESKASRKEREREERMRETIGEMKRLFKGVHGRLSELVRVTQQAYNLALAVVMGASMDSVVVDDERAAKECVGYLKQRRLPPMTFVPLRTIKVKPPNERLREQLAGVASLALDLLDYEPHLERAFMHACGSTLVCDDEDTAKRLAFGRGAERHKVVTKAGLLIAKSGAMTGGGTDGLACKAARFDEAHNAGLRQELAGIEGELQALPSDEEGRKRFQALEADIKRLETQIGLLQQEIQADKGRVSTNEGEMALLAGKKAELEAEVAALQARVDAQRAKVQDVQARINAVEDEALAPLSREAGLPSIRKYLEENHETVQRAEAERISRAKHRARVSQQLKYEQGASRPEVAARLQRELDRSRARLEELDATRAAEEAAVAAVEADVARLEEEVKRVREAADTAERELKALKKAEVAKTEEGQRLMQARQRHAAAVDAQLTKQADILQTAVLEQIALPRLDDGGGAEPMEVDGDADPAKATRNAVAALDFGRLSRQHKAAASEDDRVRLDKEFCADIEERKAALSRGEPNLKALEQYKEAKERDDKEKAELEEARRAKAEAERAFLEVREKRTDAFMRALDHVKDVINTIYKDLTKSKVHPVGGTAYLSLESAEEACFQTGVIFSAVPPAKRWRQMEELSGGEKARRVLCASENGRACGLQLTRRASIADGGGAGAAARHSELQPGALLRPGRGGRRAGRSQRRARGGLHPAAHAAGRRLARLPGGRHLAQGPVLQPGRRAGGRDQGRAARRLQHRAHARPQPLRRAGAVRRAAACVCCRTTA